MKVSSYAVARPAYFDRNSASVQNAYSGTVAPHGNTERWSRTIAAGKSGFVENTFAMTLRSAVAAPAADTVCFIQCVTSDTTSGVVTFIQHADNTLRVNRSIVLTTVGLLQAGDIIRAYSYDTSTGGTNDFYLNVKLTLFDK